MASSDTIIIRHDELWPVGAIYITAANKNPNTFLKFGTWSLIGNGRMIMGAASTDKGLETGGSMSKSVPLLAHTHTTPNHTHTTGNESANHTHSVGAHAHNLGQRVYGFNTSDTVNSVYVMNGGESTMPAVYRNNLWNGFTNSAVATLNSSAFASGTVSANHTHSIASSGGGTTGESGTANATMDVTNSYIKLFIWQRTA